MGRSNDHAAARRLIPLRESFSFHKVDLPWDMRRRAGGFSSQTTSSRTSCEALTWVWARKVREIVWMIRPTKRPRWPRRGGTFSQGDVISGNVLKGEQEKCEKP